MWQGPLVFATTGNAAVNFSSGFYVDGVTQHLEASTECSVSTCGEYATERTHFGFISTRLDTESLLGQRPLHPIPVLVRAETSDITMSADAARRELTEEMRVFMAGVRLEDLAGPYRKQLGH